MTGGRGVWEVGVNRRLWDHQGSFTTVDTDGDGVTDAALTPSGEVAYKATPRPTSYTLPLLALAAVAAGALLGRRARR